MVDFFFGMGCDRLRNHFVTGLNAADYTTLFKRMAQLDIEIEDLPQSEDVIIALDSSGVKVTNRGEWMRERWKRRRGWVRVRRYITEHRTGLRWERT